MRGPSGHDHEQDKCCPLFLCRVAHVDAYLYCLLDGSHLCNQISLDGCLQLFELVVCDY